MKIQKLHVRHVKGVREIDIHANPTCNEIAGPNGAGKSSVLDSIVFALGGAKQIDRRPLRDGEGKGEILITTDDGWEVIRRFTEGRSPTLIVREKGEKRGQRDLNTLFSDFSFDPLAFSRMKPAQQIDTLQKLAGEEFCGQLAQLDADIATQVDDRRSLRRDIEKMGDLPKVEKVERVNTKALMEKLKEYQEHNREQNTRRLEIVEAEQWVTDAHLALEEAQRELEQAKHHLSRLPETEPLKDESKLVQAIAEAGSVNSQANEYERYQKRLNKLKALNQHYLALDETIAQLRDDREQLASSVQLPVDGVSFSDSGIRVHGIPFDQLSSSEQIRVSARIGAAVNNTLRIMLIKDGSLLDETSFAELVSVAEAENVQLWVETVGEGHGDAIHLEAGELRGYDFNQLDEF